MKILITGGRGFIGSKLIDFLKVHGQVPVIFEGDISRAEDFVKYRDQGIEAVVHLAAKLSGKKSRDFYRVNFQGTQQVVDFCRQQGVERLIFFSSSKVLSNLKNPYLDSKRAAEKIIIDSGVAYVIIRPGMVYGPGDTKNISQLITLAKKSPLLPMADFKLRPVYLDDLLEVAYACLSVNPGQIFNVVGTETVSSKEILNSLKKQGIKTRPLILPKMFNQFLWLLAYLPFSPLPAWQVKSLLANEEFKEINWPSIFNLKPTLFKEGLNKILKES